MKLILKNGLVGLTMFFGGLASQAHAGPIYNFVAQHSGKCLNVYNLSTENGGDVVQATDCDQDSSRWELISLGSGYFNIKSVWSGMCLNVLNYGTENGDDVVQAEDCGVLTSQWYFTGTSTDYRYNIKNRYSGLCLNVLNLSGANGANVVQAEDCGLLSSQWELD